MKKSKKFQSKQNQRRTLALCGAVAVLFTLIAASQWEGNAAVSPDILERGYFAATNSFPRNTVVDITNLENGKKIRVVIVDGLDNPGLLITLSRDAAETIGLPLKSLGRVRIEQPADEEAYSEFIKGTPDTTAAAKPAPDPATQAPAATDGTLPTKQTALPPPEEEIPPPAAAANPPVVAANPPATQPEDISTNYQPSLPRVELKRDTNPQPIWTEAADQTGTRTPDITPVSDSSTENIQITITEHPDVEPLASVETELPLALPETTQPDLKLANPDTSYEFALVPDSERPPEASLPPELPPESVIAPLPLPDLAAQPVPDATAFIEPVAEAPPSDSVSDTIATAPVVEAPPPDSAPDSTAFIAPIAEAPPPGPAPDSTVFIAPVAEPPPTSVPDSTAFIAPIVEAPRPTSTPDSTAFIDPVAEPRPTSTPDSTAFIAPIVEAPRPTSTPDSTAFIDPVAEPRPTSTPDSTAFIAPVAEAPRQVRPDSTAFIRPVPETSPTVPDPNAFIVPIGEAPRGSVPDPSAFIAPIGDGLQRRTAPNVIADVPPPAPAPAPDSSAFITPVSAAPPRAPATNERFSIPSVTRLEQGKYYVQLRAYNRRDQLEDAAATIGQAYPLAVQSAGTQDNPLFRLLIGPVNLGESGALLQRFKGIGYKDAFIRKGS